MIPAAQMISTFSTPSYSSDSSMATSEASLDPIILIEDEEVLLQTYTHLLEQTIPEYEILAHNNGSDGLKTIREVNPSLIITDLRLPDIDGLLILDEVSKKHPNVPVIVVSGFFGLDQIKEVIGEPENITFISKPFDPHIFGSFIETLLSIKADCTINGISLLNIMQMISADQKSCYLELMEGDRSGVVSFTDGEVRFARTERFRGVDAIMQISEWKNPIILIFNNRKTTKVNIHNVKTETLLLGMVHHLDQINNPSKE